jgi:hypothetical protein
VARPSTSPIEKQNEHVDPERGSRRLTSQLGEGTSAFSDPSQRRAKGGRSLVASVSSRMARARSMSPARASASARVILASPSKVRTFCSRKSSAPRRMSLSPLSSVLPSAFAAPSRKIPIGSPHQEIMLMRESGKFGRIRCCTREVAAHQFKYGCEAHSVCARANMGEGCGPAAQTARRSQPG